MPLTINPHEMQQITKLLDGASRAPKLNLGRWNWSKEEPYLSVDSVSKAPLWSDIEWANLRAALTKPLIEPHLNVIDKEKTTRVWLTAPQRNEEPIGPHIEALTPIAGKALPCEVALRNYSMVWTLHSHGPDCSKSMPKKSDRGSECGAAR